jgi:alpha-tubulin suppressor-like RCC1 family protein
MDSEIPESCDIFFLLHDEIIISIALFLSLNDLINLYLTKSRFNKIICCNEYFWQQRCYQDYGIKTINPIESWKSVYSNSVNVFICGTNYRQLGLGDNNEDRDKPTQIPKLKARQISAGLAHTVVIDLNSNVITFGYNKHGQLGLGDTQDRNIPMKISNLKVKEISAGRDHTVLIDLNNNVWSFGANEYGQLGLDNFEHMSIPTKIPNLEAKHVSAGESHTIVIDLNDDIWVFGYNKDGQLGLGDNQNRSKPTRILNIKAKQICAKGNYTAVIDFNDNIWVFGSNEFGQLGLGNFEYKNIPMQILNLKAKQISLGGTHTVIIDIDDNVWSFGLNEYDQLGIDDKFKYVIDKPMQIPMLKARQVSAGDYHTMLIDLNDNLWAFGNNTYDQLGLGDIQDVHVPIPTQIPNIKARQVSVGKFHTVIITI